MIRPPWLDCAATGEIRRPLDDAALALLRLHGLETFCEQGLDLLGMPELWPAMREALSADRLAPRRVLRAYVRARAANAWWNDRAEVLRVLALAGEPLTPVSWETGRWDRHFDWPPVVAVLSAGLAPVPGVTACTWEPSDAIPQYGVLVQDGVGPTVDLMGATLRAVTESARLEAAHYTPASWRRVGALLLGEDQREAIAAAYAVGGATVGATTLRACRPRG